MNKSKCFAALFMAAVFGLSACAKDPTFVKAASSTMPAFETDFTVAAEKTVNAVVCIKSYTTRSRNQYGGFMAKKWKSYLRRANKKSPSWDEVMDRVESFFSVIWEHICQNIVYLGDLG